MIAEDSAQAFSHLQPSSSSPWAAVSTLAGLCWELADRQVLSSKLNRILESKIKTHIYMSIHMVRVQFVDSELLIRCLLYIRRMLVRLSVVVCPYYYNLVANQVLFVFQQRT